MFIFALIIGVPNISKLLIEEGKIFTLPVLSVTVPNDNLLIIPFGIIKYVACNL